MTLITSPPSLGTDFPGSKTKKENNQVKMFKKGGKETIWHGCKYIFGAKNDC